MVFNCTVTGFSHKAEDRVCQDNSVSWADPLRDVHILAVSDGHGGDGYPLSHIGAEYACRVALETLSEFSKECTCCPSTAMIHQVIRAIISRWHASLGSDAPNKYGCTLIAYLQTPSFWMGLQIGDGKMVTYGKDGTWCQPIPWDDRCILNFTTSMCDEDAFGNFRIASGTDLPNAVFLATDGIDSTFQDGELLYNFYRNMIHAANADGEESMLSSLPDCLAHFSEVGSGDDMSISAIIKVNNQN